MPNDGKGGWMDCRVSCLGGGGGISVKRGIFAFSMIVASVMMFDGHDEGDKGADIILLVAGWDRK